MINLSKVYLDQPIKGTNDQIKPPVQQPSITKYITVLLKLLILNGL